MLKNLLLYRFILFNAAMVSFMAWLASKGYIMTVLASDPTGISLGIMCLFVWTGLNTIVQAWKVTKEKNAVKSGKYIAEGKMKRIIKLNRIERSSETMTLLGLAGTLVGFIFAFAMSDVSSLVGHENVGLGVAHMMKGMGIALYTTLTGIVLGGWTGINHHMLKEQVDILEVDGSTVKLDLRMPR